MPPKGKLTAAEPLEFSDYLRLLSCLHDDGNYLWELYCCISFCTGCRVSDVLSIRWKDIIGKDSLCKVEQKTGKARQIPMNTSVQQRIEYLYEKLGSPDKEDPVICSKRTRKAFTIQYVNATLKKFRLKYKLPIKQFSSHTFRKTFGRYVYDSMGRSMEALFLLAMIFKHSSPQVTMVYLGIRQDEIDKIFNTIQLEY